MKIVAMFGGIALAGAAVAAGIMMLVPFWVAIGGAAIGIGLICYGSMQGVELHDIDEERRFVLAANGWRNNLTPDMAKERSMRLFNSLYSRLKHLGSHVSADPIERRYLETANRYYQIAERKRDKAKNFDSIDWFFTLAALEAASELVESCCSLIEEREDKIYDEPGMLTSTAEQECPGATDTPILEEGLDPVEQGREYDSTRPTDEVDTPNREPSAGFCRTINGSRGYGLEEIDETEAAGPSQTLH